MDGLQRKLTLYGLTMIAVGSCIGAGIFITPYKIVQALPHNGYVLVIWAIGGLIALTATLGDLLESAFKRARGVKDSGRILPGHGGILDRFDGFLLAVPAVVLYLQLIR